MNVCDYEFDYQDWKMLLHFFESHYENLTSDEKNSICNDLYNRQQELMQQYIEDRLVVTPTAEVGADGAVTITADNSYADFIDIKVYSGSDIVWGASTDSVATVESEVYKVNTTENTQSTVLNVVYNLDSSGQTPLKALKEIYSVRLYNTSESQISVSSAVYGQNGVVGSLASYRSAEIVKSVENAFRHVDITLANQLFVAFPNLDIREVLKLVGTKWNKRCC